MSQFGNRAVNMFGLFEIPVLVVPDRELGKFFHDLHTDIIWPLLLLLTVAHIGAALYHQFVQKDGLISRMR
jgi:cytochrome b561